MRLLRKPKTIKEFFIKKKQKFPEPEFKIEI